MTGSANDDSSEECIVENQNTSADQLVSSDPPDAYDIFGEPRMPTRVGDEYQVEIPALVTEAEILASSKFITKSIESNNDSSFSQNENLKLSDVQGFFPDSVSLNNSWSDFEQESFLLGLYIFGKNLVQVKNFMESKEMGDILSFYYGKFYRSDGHLRWSECRKIRSKRCIHGHRIFTGWRQQALLSRLLPRVPEDSQLTLLEVSRKFGDAKISLEEYVSTLKAKVGVAVLIEVIGIGKGKHDLTGIVTEPLMVNQAARTRPEAPVRKPFASLTYDEIVEFLTGDFRLSKNRANDLFWEAVWPRLLAKGWHSEEPKRRKDSVRSRHSLVFLVPGVKKFSRRKQVKGIHYFDSVSDILRKVASRPRLVQLEIEKDDSEDSDVDEFVTKVPLDKDKHSDHQRNGVHQPPLSNSSPAEIEFTIVDTSSACGEKPGMIRNMRKLPNGPAPSVARKDNDDGCKLPADDLDSMDMSSNDEMHTDVSSCAVGVLKQGIPAKDVEPSNAPVHSPKEGTGEISDSSANKNMMCQPSRANFLEHMNISTDSKNDGHTSSSDKNSNKVIQCQFSRRRKEGQENSSAPVTKRRRLTACSHDDSRSTDSLLEPKVNETELHFEAPPSHENLSTGPTASNANNVIASPERIVPQLSIDLNLPHPSTDFDFNDRGSIKTENIQESQNVDLPPFPSEANHLPENSEQSNTSDHDEANAEDPGRRHSKRNRPLTAKALEALACGFLTNKRKWRGMELA